MYSELKLDASVSNWRLFMVRKADSAFLKFQEKIFIRDDHTCQFCGFRSKEQMEVVNFNHNFRDNRVDNLTTICYLCVQSFFLEAVGKGEFGGGALIYLPEMSQCELNALCHIIFIALISGGELATQAKNIYRSMRLRTQQIEKELGEGMSNPALYGQLLIDAQTEGIHALHQQVSKYIRLLPDFLSFVPQIKALAVSGLSTLGQV